MLLTILVCVCVPIAIVMSGSRRYVPAWIVCVGLCALAVTMAALQLTTYVGLPVHPWHGPMLLSYSLIVLGTLTGWVALKVDSPIGIAAIIGRLGSGVAFVFVARRRRRSLAADVRRRVKDYRIEVV